MAFYQKKPLYALLNSMYFKICMSVSEYPQISLCFTVLGWLKAFAAQLCFDLKLSRLSAAKMATSSCACTHALLKFLKFLKFDPVNNFFKIPRFRALEDF